MKKSLTTLITAGMIAAAVVTFFALTHERASVITSEAPQKSEGKASSAIVVTTESNQSETQKADKYSSQTFKSLAARTLSDLPTNANLRKLTAAEVHHTPAILFKAANKLADVAEALDARLKHVESNSTEKAKVIQDGLAFYQECLNGNERPDAVRALCYSHYRELRKVSGKPETKEESQRVPESIRSLVELVANR